MAEGISFISGTNDQENLERQLSGKIDYMLCDDLLIQYLLKYQVNDISEYLEIGNTPNCFKIFTFCTT